MQKFKFTGSIVVEVSTSPLDRPEPGNPYTIFDCLCRPLGRKKGFRKQYQVTATTKSQAARFAVESYRKDIVNYGQQTN